MPAGRARPARSPGGPSLNSPRKWTPPALQGNSTAGEAFVAVVRAALEQIDANATGAAAARDPEYLHQLRVGVRRLRSALRAFRKLLKRGAADTVERPWRTMMHTLGEARDWDVLCASLEVQALRPAAQLRRTAAQGKVRELLRSPGFRAARKRSFAWSQGGPWRRGARPAAPLRRFAAQALQRLHGKLREEARGIDWRDAARRHQVRIRVKRLRYACDFFASQFAGKAARRYLDALRTLQDVFGEMNDADVQRRLLRRLAPRGSALAVVKAEAAARARLAGRERELVSALQPAWTAFEERRPFWQRASAARDPG